MVETIKVKEFFDDRASTGYADTYVAAHQYMAFAFVNKEQEMVGPFTSCKEYLKSRLFGSLQEKDAQYCWRKTWGKVDLNSTRLLIARSVPNINEEEVKLIVNLLNQLEKDLGLMPTTYSKVTGITNYKSAFLLTGSKRWMLSPPMLDLYAYLIRNAKDFHKKGQSYLETIALIYDNNVIQSYKPQILEMVKHIVKEKYWKVFGKDFDKNWPLTESTSQIGAAGIVVFSSSKYKKETWPHWLSVPLLPTVKDASVVVTLR